MNKRDRDELLLILKDQVEFFKNQVVNLKEEKELLQKQNFNLQDALVAIRSPEAYRDLQRDNVPINPLIAEEMKKQQVYATYLPKYLKTLEGPTFENVDDMIKTLGGVISEEGIKSESIHGNTES